MEKNKEYFVLIGQKDGIYKKAKIEVQDGCPFYSTKEGYYDPWGHFFSKEETEKLNKRTRELMSN
ncbi:MAG: hypothetical protein K6T16_03120 [Candidatus Pacearchaeota archaeon]|nr:hypothetical protein [Candidatus Pacearchaeota archaeon]